ncbi:MAG: MFS transporter [Thermodesulfovibrionales bacterium]
MAGGGPPGGAEGPRVMEEPRARGGLIRALGFVIFLSVLNGTMFNVSVPDIASEFGLKPSAVSWVVTGYIVLFALGSLTYGRLADLAPVRNLITAGLVLLNAGSVMGLLSPWYPALVAARVVQAAGGSAIPALAMLIATGYFPPHLRGRTLGVIASTVALSAGVGPILGGYITGALGWRYLFVPPLATALAIPALRRHLPAGGGGRGLLRGFDALGALLVTGGAGLLLLAVTGTSWVALVAGSALLAAYLVHQRRAPEPFVKAALFARAPFRGVIAASFLSMGTVFGLMFMAPIMLRDLEGLGAEWIGLAMFPGAIGAAVLGTLGGRLADRAGSARVVYLGISLLVGGYVLLSTAAGHGALAVCLGLVAPYAGFAFLQSALPHTVSSTLSPGEMGTGMGLYNLFFFVSGAFSAAALGKLMDFAALGFNLNPFFASAEALNYRNLFVLLAVTAALSALVFRRAFPPREGDIDSHKAP